MALINATDAKLGSFSILEAFGMGFIKVLTEQVQTPFIGNGTYFSGALKIGEAWAVGKFFGSNNIARMTANALVIDGVEDIISNIFAGGTHDSQIKSQYI